MKIDFFSRKTTEKLYQQQNATKGDSEGYISGQREIFPGRGAEMLVGMVGGSRNQ